MAVIGVVGEFNPFHLGHSDHFAQSREILGEDTPIVCVISGDFVQRGDPAIFSKHRRARAAAESGADLVFELPLPWCLASAETFARGAVGLLHSLGTVTHLSFGSEGGSLEELGDLATGAAAPENIEKIKETMAAGMSFAAAREQVLSESVGETAKLLEMPNNILAVEYLKTLAALDSPMIPLNTRRRGAQHDGTSSSGRFRSAAQIREMIAAGEDVSDYMPEEAWDVFMEDVTAGRGPVTMTGLEQAVLSRLRMLPEEKFQYLPDASEGLGNRLYKAVRQAPTYEAALWMVKTKRYPMSRLRRMAMCAALGVREDMARGTPSYARLLAFTERGRLLLRDMSKKTAVPILNKPATAHALPDDCSREIFRLTADARDLYVLGCPAVGERSGGSDWRNGPAAL